MGRELRLDKGGGFWQCSECGWLYEYLTLVDAPSGQLEQELRLLLITERDKRFASHICAEYPKKRAEPD
jgi:hypothetical protein